MDTYLRLYMVATLLFVASLLIHKILLLRAYSKLTKKQQNALQKLVNTKENIRYRMSFYAVPVIACVLFLISLYFFTNVIEIFFYFVFGLIFIHLLMSTFLVPKKYWEITPPVYKRTYFGGMLLKWATYLFWLYAMYVDIYPAFQVSLEF